MTLALVIALIGLSIAMFIMTGLFSMCLTYIQTLHANKKPEDKSPLEEIFNMKRK